MSYFKPNKTQYVFGKSSDAPNFVFLTVESTSNKEPGSIRIRVTINAATINGNTAFLCGKREKVRLEKDKFVVLTNEDDVVCTISFPSKIIDDLAELFSSGKWENGFRNVIVETENVLSKHIDPERGVLSAECGGVRVDFNDSLKNSKAMLNSFNDSASFRTAEDAVHISIVY
jgi:hypothetical protein